MNPLLYLDHASSNCARAGTPCSTSGEELLALVELVVMLVLADHLHNP